VVAKTPTSKPKPGAAPHHHSGNIKGDPKALVRAMKNAAKTTKRK